MTDHSRLTGDGGLDADGLAGLAEPGADQSIVLVRVPRLDVVGLAGCGLDARSCRCLRERLGAADGRVDGGTVHGRRRCSEEPDDDQRDHADDECADESVTLRKEDDHDAHGHREPEEHGGDQVDR